MCRRNVYGVMYYVSVCGRVQATSIYYYIYIQVIYILYGCGLGMSRDYAMHIYMCYSLLELPIRSVQLCHLSLIPGLWLLKMSTKDRLQVFPSRM